MQHRIIALSVLALSLLLGACEKKAPILGRTGFGDALQSATLFRALDGANAPPAGRPSV